MKKSLLALVVLVCVGCALKKESVTLWENWGGYFFTLDNSDLHVEVDLMRKTIKDKISTRFFAQVTNKSNEVIVLSHDGFQLICNGFTFHVCPGSTLNKGDIGIPIQFPKDLLPGESIRVFFAPYLEKPTLHKTGPNKGFVKYGNMAVAVCPTRIKSISLGGAISNKYDQKEFHINYTAPKEPRYGIKTLPKLKIFPGFGAF